jgi:outer membrane protein assembly factor BamD
VVKQFQDARSEMPEDLCPRTRTATDPPEGPKEAEKDRSWFSYMTFGMFD